MADAVEIVIDPAPTLELINEVTNIEIVIETGIRGEKGEKGDPGPGVDALTDYIDAGDAALDARLDTVEATLSGKSNVGHTHSIADVSSLQTALDGKAAASHGHTASQISDASAVGKAVLIAPDAPTARSAIGAGTSNLALGTTSTTAAAGNHTHTSADVNDFTEAVQDVVGAQIVAGTGATVSYDDASGSVTISATGQSPSYANLPAGTTLTVSKTGGTWPARPTSRADIVVQWKGPEPSPAIVSSGTGGMIDNVDLRLVTP